MRHLFHAKKAQMGMVGAAIGLLITLIISILVYYNIAASIDTSSIDTKMGWNGSTGHEVGAGQTRPAWNATGDINDQAATFYTIAPIVVIVIVAVIVIGYVQRIGG